MVFQRPFRIVHDEMLDPPRPGEAALSGQTSLTISATLNDQACDDKICYMPETIPLAWRTAGKPVERERVKR